MVPIRRILCALFGTMSARYVKGAIEGYPSFGFSPFGDYSFQRRLFKHAGGMD